jgi:GTP-binding protein Era
MAFRCGYVALVGAPNAGKSTLLNQLLHQRLAIVSPKPQTTRRRTLGIVGGEDYQAVLLDTPGILEPKYALQAAMMQTVASVLADADVACLLVDATSFRNPEDALPPALTSFPRRRVLALNKIDRLRSKEEMLPVLEALGGTGLFQEMVPISALKGEGVDRLLEVLVRELPEAPALYPADQLSEHPERFFVAELIREQVFFRFQEEVPYAVEVEIEDFKERPGAKDFVAANLFVEQASQKAILIGHGGQAIRDLGAAARESIEEFLGRPVYLELRVKVAPKWRRDQKALRRFGYHA